MTTRAEYVRYLRSLEGGYGPARGRSNNGNQFNDWYYGRRVSGDNYAWCFVTICYVQNHFGTLTENGGKAAYVPNAKARAQKAGAKVATHPGSTRAMKPGDQLCFDFNRSGEPEHTGTFVKAISSTEFYSTEGNTSTSTYSDALALKRRSVRDVLWHIELLGVDGAATSTSTEDEDMPDYVSLSTKKPQAVKAGQAANVVFDTENSDKGKAHADGAFPGILSGGKNGTLFNLEVKTTGSAGTFTLIEVDPAKKYAQHKSDYAVHPVGESHTYVGLCDPGMHLYVQFSPSADGAASAVAKGLYWHR
jgi:hypothetical protein